MAIAPPLAADTLLGLSPSIKFIPSLSFDGQGSPVQPGKALTQSGTSSQPSLSWHPLAASGGQVPKHLLSQVRVHGAKPGEEGSGQDKRMLVLMFDPDAPSPQVREALVATVARRDGQPLMQRR